MTRDATGADLNLVNRNADRDASKGVTEIVIPLAGAAIAPHLAVMERIMTMPTEGQYIKGSGTDPEVNPRWEEAQEFAAHQTAEINNPRRARAQAQPRVGGRFTSEDPWVRVRQSELETEREWWRGRLKQSAKEVFAHLATIAERDAEIAKHAFQLAEAKDRLDEEVDTNCQARLSAIMEMDRLNKEIAEGKAENAWMRSVDAEMDGSIDAMAGTIRDQQAELTRLRARSVDLIPMPALKLGIFIGSFVTMLVMTGLAYFTHLI